MFNAGDPREMIAGKDVDQALEMDTIYLLVRSPSSHKMSSL